MLDGISFASDNYSGVHPRVLDAIASHSGGHYGAYGTDEISERVQALFRQTFGNSAHVFFVYNGTGANVASLAALLKPYQSVICADCAHINVDEGGAPEAFTGAKLLTVPTEGGKMTPEGIASHLGRVGDQHFAQPGVVSITQSTEYGTLYSLDELTALVRVAHEHGLKVHMDGARLANAAVALGCSLRAVSADIGVDVLSFGGTKNGLMFGEAVVVFDEAVAAEFAYVRKRCGQLHSKMRFISAQYEALLTDDLWRKNAEISNAMAQLLAREAGKLEGIEITQAVEVNAVFARVPREAVSAMQAVAPFYVWNEETCEVRWMTSFDTTEEHVLGFVDGIRGVLASM